MSRRSARPRTALDHLEHEERRALDDLARALAAAGEGLPAIGQVRAVARRHPELTLAASAALGVLLAPALAGCARAALPVLLRTGAGGVRSLAALTLRSLR